MKIIAIPLSEVPIIHSELAGVDEKWALISIHTLQEKLPTLESINPKNSENFKGLLQLVFYDIDYLDEVKNRFSTQQADEVLDFFDVQKDVDLLVVHCEAGYCRSPAIAAAISKIFYGLDGFFFDRYVPNRHVYRTMLEMAHRRRLI